jgi:hypothetical protein
MASQQSKETDWQVKENGNLTQWQVDKMPKYQNGELPLWQVNK